jgi:hypothetical protein
MATKQAAEKSKTENVITVDRRRNDRRDENAEAVDSNATPRRRKQRRRHIDPTTCERDYNDQEIEFMRAMDDYKQASGRMFPTCSEVLEVIRNLGYIQLGNDQIEELGLDVSEEPATIAEGDGELAEV